jgi:hypothetical protein
MRYLPFAVESPLRGLKFRLSRRLSTRHATEIWPGLEATAISVRPFAGCSCNVKQHELEVLCAVARHTGARQLFEFGTFDGLTAWHLALNCGPDARVWTLDLPLGHPARFSAGYARSADKIYGSAVGAKFASTEEAERVEQLYADSLEFDAEPYRGRMDFCFVDASHEYEHVRRDTANALAMVRPGGVIFWHDYSRWWPGVQKCLDTLSGELPLFRVFNTALAALVRP